ncbi:MAG: hypothetical protein WC374_04715 [Phycisphaerae bacterium]|jgi:hypothetical protein
MTNRVKTLTVILDKEYREDDAEATIINAISMIKGVMHVEAKVFDSDQQLARYDGMLETKRKMYEFLATLE